MAVALERIHVEYVEGTSAEGRKDKYPRVSYVGLGVDLAWPSDRVYNLAFPVKGPTKGDPHGETREKALSGAVDQVLRGAAGFSEFLSKEPHLMARERDSAAGAVLPVVFTTARLFVSDVELTTSELVSGKVAAGALRPMDWLWLKQNVSSELRHASSARPWPKLRDYVARDYARCVGIVSVAGIVAFLNNGVPQ
jgi:hypothetical protein